MQIHISDFGNGMAKDYTKGGVGECSVAKHFDLLTYPSRLHPIRGMTATGEISNSKLGNIILGSNGTFYGIGTDPSNPTLGELYKRTGIGATDFWIDFTADQLSGAAVFYDFLVHYSDMRSATQLRSLYWAAANLIVATDPEDGGGSADTDALTFSTIGQGLVHPSDKILYFPYQTSAATYIGKISTHATDAFGTVNYTALLLPSRYRAYCLSHFNDYLAIPLTVASGGAFLRSVVYLWGRDTTLTTIDNFIPWGEGSLKVLNNLNGALIGISEFAGNSVAAQDTDKIQIKIYAGGAEPFVVKEIVATRLTSTAPSCKINPRVNFIHNNRLYFSVDIVNGATAVNYSGLWSVGRNENGIWTVYPERMATTDGSETSVIAAGMTGDFATMVHTAVGTVTFSVNGNAADGTYYTATSVYESCINPEMPKEDRAKSKQLTLVYATYLPLPTNGSVTMQYRVDSDRNGAWTTIFTESTNSAVRTQKIHNTDGATFKDGTHYEFRLTSTGGAIITGYGYAYDPIPIS